jgi:hypothetical protein
MIEPLIAWPWMTGRIIRRIVIAGVTVFFAMTLFYSFAFIPPGVERYGHIIKALIQVAGIVFVGFYKKITVRVKSWLLALSVVSCESVFALFMGGDQIYLIVITACTVVSFAFLRPRGLLL